MRQEHGMKTPYIAGEHNNVILLTSLMTMPVYEADFGWGKPMQFGLPRGSLDDRVGILPSPDGDGVVVNVFFQEAILQRFKKLFYEDVYISSL
nr:unknown [Glycine max]